MEDYSNLFYSDDFVSLEDLQEKEDDYVNHKKGDCCSGDNFYCNFCPCRDDCIGGWLWFQTFMTL